MLSKIPSAGFQDNVKFRNICQNGDMSISQRSTSQASITSSGYYTVDRFKFNVVNLGTWTMSQDTDVPTAQGFSKSLKLDCTTADGSPASSDAMNIQTRFEGQNLQYLKKGTSSALSLTASFWVKSNKTGTYILELFDNDNNRHINKSYTISSADTWEKKTITFDGDTSGTLDNDNNASLDLTFWLGAGTDYTSGTLATSWQSFDNTDRAVGQVNLADSTSNEWYITGVQLEAGTTASDFEFLPHDVNLQRCLRYYEKSNNLNLFPGDTNADGYITWNFVKASSNQNYITTVFSVTKRDEPTITFYSPHSGTSGKYRNYTDNVDYDATANRVGHNSFVFRPSANTGISLGDIVSFQFTADAEL